MSWSLLVAALIPHAVLATPLSTNTYNIPNRPQLNIAPLTVSEHPYGTINNSYIVVLRDELPQAAMQNHLNFLQFAHASDSFLGDGVAAGIRHIYGGHLKGYAGEFTNNVIEQLRRMPEVDFIEKDQIIRTMDLETQKGSPWVSTCMDSVASVRLILCKGSRPYQPPAEAEIPNFHQVSLRLGRR